MRCPTCGNEVPARPIYLRCGASLFGSPPPALPASALGPIRVPLTTGQKVRLLATCVPRFGLALECCKFPAERVMGESLASGLIVFALAGKTPIPDKASCAGKLTQLCFLFGRRRQPIAIGGLNFCSDSTPLRRDRPGAELPDAVRPACARFPP
jgi:hypothetical protein